MKKFKINLPQINCYPKELENKYTLGSIQNLFYYQKDNLYGVPPYCNWSCK